MQRSRCSAARAHFQQYPVIWLSFKAGGGADRSSVSSGDGRVDALVIPKVPGGVGVILEFKKVAEEREIDGALAEALRQIGENRYAVKLTEAEAGTIHRYGVVSCGKRVRVRVRAG